jgi:hypothetical protein
MERLGEKEDNTAKYGITIASAGGVLIVGSIIADKLNYLDVYDFMIPASFAITGVGLGITAYATTSPRLSSGNKRKDDLLTSALSFMSLGSLSSAVTFSVVSDPYFKPAILTSTGLGVIGYALFLASVLS